MITPFFFPHQNWPRELGLTKVINVKEESCVTIRVTLSNTLKVLFQTRSFKTPWQNSENMKQPSMCPLLQRLSLWLCAHYLQGKMGQDYRKNNSCLAYASKSLIPWGNTEGSSRENVWGKTETELPTSPGVSNVSQV